MSAEITRWRVKNPVIEAVQWTGDNIGDVFELAGCTHFDSVDAVDAANSDDPDATAQLLETVHSTWVPVSDGDWIVRGVTGLLFAVGDEKFRGDYEPYAAPPPAGRDALEQLAAVKPVVIVFDPRECTTDYIDEIAAAVREQSGGRVVITNVDAEMSDVMIAIADREISADEAEAIWTEQCFGEDDD